MLILLIFFFKFIYAEQLAACDSQIYCDGPLLHAVQTARLFKDGKTFVDMHMKDSPENVMTAFKALPNHNKTTLQEFVAHYFSGPGEELEKWEPEDYVKLPSFLNDVKDPLLKDFGWDLCRIWKDLGRKVKEDVKTNPERYSMVYLPNPFIVPGGRFRETFYWDSYWVIKGLLVCEMNTTVKGMLENFVHYMNTYGLVPNGGRVYFTRRSQPPFLTQMMYDYLKTTGDLDFIRNNIHILDAEYDFWQNNRSVTVEKNGKVYYLNQYRSNVVKPRPESYAEDLMTASLKDQAERPELFSNLVSACESGWDFSSRWFARNGEDDKNLTLDKIETMSIVPVDLNSILCKNEWLLGELHQILGNKTKASFYNEQWSQRVFAVRDILYNKDTGIWQDYSLKTNQSLKYFYMSNIFPVFMNCTDLDEDIYDRVWQYILKNGIPDFKGGVPTSLYETGQQWDYPNAWAPLEHIMIWSLQSLPQTRTIANNLAETWIKSNFMGWQRTRGMYEKYNVQNPGTRGGGGEYDIQEGFGWTNGVALEIIKKYGSTLSVSKPSSSSENCTNSASVIQFVKGLTTLTLTCIIMLLIK